MLSAAGLLASCSASGSFGVFTSLERMPSGQAEPVIRGTVTIIGGDFMHVGFGASVRLTRLSDAEHASRTLLTDSGGRFFAGLPAGSYAITGLVPKGSSVRCPSTHEVDVPQDYMAEVSIECE